MKLNEAQRRAVKAPTKPMLVLAGPGTGKTRTLIKRIEYYLTGKKFSPEEILAITFTNKAAQEVKERLRESAGEKADEVETGTFHSFCLKLIRENHNFFGLPRYFNIADSEYQERIIREFINLPNPEYNRIKGILRGISNHKIKKIPLKSEYMQDAWNYYSGVLKSINAVDFDDIMILSRSLLTMRADVLEHWQNRFKAILVDEFQDTDSIQYEIIRELALKHKNIFIVADDDQSIFSWRGADPGNIERFINDFNISEKQIIVLDKNYRTTAEIFNLAQKPLLPTARIFPQKKIEVVKEGGKAVEIRAFQDRQREGKFIAGKIKQWLKNEPEISYSDIAVIYPRHVIGKQIEKELLKERIPCRMASGKSLLGHPAVKNILAYLRFALNPGDKYAFRSIFEINLEQPTFIKTDHLAYKLGNNFRMAVTKAMLLPDFSVYEIQQIKAILGKISNVLSDSRQLSLHQLLIKILNGLKQDDIFYLRDNISSLSDPLNDYKENSSAISELEKSIQQNLPIVINSGYPATDYLLKTLVYRFFPNLQAHTMREALSRSQNSPLNNALFILPQNETASLPESQKNSLKIHIGNCEADTSNGNGFCFRTDLNTFSAGFFKLLQALKTNDSEALFSNYSIVDLETTDKDVENCDIVEIAAVKIRDHRIVDRFQKLVKPRRPISRGAQEVHGISEKNVRNAPLIDEIWPEFLGFIGNDLLLAHNGVNFDFRILNRIHKKLTGNKLENTVFDTLPFARDVFPNSPNSIDALAERYSLDPGNRHRALDDVIVLKDIFEKINIDYNRQLRLTGFEEILPVITMAMAFENQIFNAEEQLLYQIGYMSIKYRKPPILSKLREITEQSIDSLLGKFGSIYNSQPPLISGDQLSREKLQELFLLAMEYEQQYKNHQEAISQFIQFLALYNDAQMLDNSVNAVNLLTLHTSKGLEFSKVIIAGLEDNNLPSYWSYQTDDLDDIPISRKQEEQRRLFYVGMTRAKDELILTSSKISEQLREEKPSPFLRELL